MKNKLIVMLALSLVPTAGLLAQTITPKYSPGFTVSATVQLRANAAGDLEAVPGSYVIGGTITTNPNPAPPTDPLGLTVRAKAFKATAEQISDPTTARQLGAFYLGMKDYTVAYPNVTRTDLETAVSGGEAIFLRDPTTATRWKPLTDQFKAEFVKAVQNGASVKDYGVLFADAGNGVNAAAPGQAMFADENFPDVGEQAINPAKIMQIIQIIVANGGKPLSITLIFQIIMILLSPV